MRGTKYKLSRICEKYIVKTFEELKKHRSNRVSQDVEIIKKNKSSGM